MLCLSGFELNSRWVPLRINNFFREKWVSFSVAETNVGSLLCCGAGIVQYLFKVIW